MDAWIAYVVVFGTVGTMVYGKYLMFSDNDKD